MSFKKSGIDLDIIKIYLPPEQSKDSQITTTMAERNSRKLSAQEYDHEADLEATLERVRKENERLKNLLSESQHEVRSFERP